MRYQGLRTSKFLFPKVRSPGVMRQRIVLCEVYVYAFDIRFCFAYNRCDRVSSTSGLDQLGK